MNRRRFLKLAGASVAGVTLVGRGAALAQESGAGLAAGRQAVVTTDSLNVRGGPRPDEPRVGTLDAGSRVDLLAVAADGVWWRIATGALVGYVHGSYLGPTDQPAESDAFDLDLPLPYAPQLTDVWCDPADIEMWMGYHQLAANIPNYGRQRALWDWETTHNAGFTVDQWDCSPFAVASAADQWMPGLGFDHFGYDDAAQGTRLLAWLLAARREPSIALIWRGLHYVLLRGVRAEGDPARDPDGARVLGFYVADPDRGSARWMGRDRFIPIDRWLSELFVPVSYRTPHTGVPGDVWQDRHVTIQRTWTGDGPTERGQPNATPDTYAS